MNLPRPRRAPRRIPLWAWHMRAWEQAGRKGPRPSRAPKRLPAWYRWWKLFRLARVKGEGSWAWKTYLKPSPVAAGRRRSASTLHGTQSPAGQGGAPRTSRPSTTPRARPGTTTSTSRKAGSPSGLTAQDSPPTATGPPAFLIRPGSATATSASPGRCSRTPQNHGRVFTDVSQARPGDPIVIGPGTGWHAVVVVEAGADPLVVSHGSEAGPKIQRLSVDPRQPKRVCQTLP
jgi:hypothetical protein